MLAAAHLMKRNVKESALPATRTTFFGRGEELAAVKGLIEGGAQLVTLLGPPGIGKTRLSIHVARALGNAVFCDLVEARDEAAMLTSIALALDVSVEAPSSAAALDALVARALAQRGDALIVLDNAEQIAGDVARAVERFIEAAPNAVFLVTSRERLRVDGEHVIAMEPLAVPPEGERDPARLLAFDAVKLLIERARSTRARFAPSEDDAVHLAQIVRRVEGMPLAIELCAARLGMLQPKQLLAKLEQRFDVLASDKRGVSSRQATLRGAIDWSWELLDAAERSVLSQCSLFRGGFDLEAAEATVLTNPRRGPQAAADSIESVLSTLTSLRDRSLLALVDEGGDAARYRLYESVREYGADKLALDPIFARAVADRHALYFAEKGRAWASAAKGASFQGGLAALARQSDNLLAARALSITHGHGARALEVTLALEPLAIVRGPVLPYLELLTATLASVEADIESSLAARAFASIGVAESRRGRPKEAVAAFSRAVERAAAAGDSSVLAFASAKLGNQLCVLGRDAEAETAFEQARLALDRREDNAIRGIWCRHYGFYLWRAGRVDESRRFAERARALLEADGDRRELAYVLSDLAASYLDVERVEDAMRALDQALQLARTLRYRRVESRCLLLYALAKREHGRLEEAEVDLRRALELHQEDGDRNAESFAIWHLACLSLEQGDISAARDLGAQAYARYVELDDAHLIAHAAMVLGAALAKDGDLVAAEAHFADANARLGAGSPQTRVALSLLRGLVTLGRAPASTTDLRLLLESTSTTDLGANVRFARRLLALALELPQVLVVTPPRLPHKPQKQDVAASNAASNALVVGDDGRWFRLFAAREVSLERRASLRRILSALARRRVESPGAALSLDEVLTTGWPGERVDVESGAARVYNAIQRLRRLGLGDILRTRDDGYLLDVETPTALAAKPAG
jgi:predicted ATPase